VLFLEGIIDIFGKTFGAGATKEKQADHYEIRYVPFPLDIFIQVKGGHYDTFIEANHGDSSKPFSVYAVGRSDAYYLSSAGLKINVFNATLGINLGLDDISIGFSVRNGNVTDTLKLKINLMELMIGLEGSTTYHMKGYDGTAYASFEISPTSLYGGGLLAKGAASALKTKNILEYVKVLG